MTLRPGTRLGLYEITSLIGEGGMGQVYRATDTLLSRSVAIKILPDAFASDLERLARFEREARTLASLNHPNIAAIYGFEKSAGLHALVMELVEGDDLSVRIARGAIPIGEALPIAKQIAGALEAAHEQGIIHRDLKPANIKVREDGTVKVLDFGLAKAGDSSASRVDATNSPTMMASMPGVILGTAAYMSPEQARGKTVDKRTDVWAFGCVLYEMLTGVRAFDGEDMTDTIAAIVRNEPRWDLPPTDVPASIRLVLRRCLEKDRGKRIGDMATVLFVLNESELAASANRPPDVTVTRASSRWSRLAPIVAAAVLAASLAGVIAWRWRPAPESPRITRFALTLPEGQQFSNVGRPMVAISPGGGRIVYVANQRLYVRSLSEATAHEIQGTAEPEGITTPAFSPDGEQIVFVSGRDRALKRISVQGGVAVTICPIEASLGVNWGPDGIVFGQLPGNVFRVSPSGGQPQLLLKADAGELVFGARTLPDGDAMLVTMGKFASLTGAGQSGVNPGAMQNPRIVWQSIRSGERKTLIERGADARYLPTGHLVYADGNALLAIRFDLRRGQVFGESVPVGEGIRRSDATPAAQFGVSDNGTLAYVPGGSSTIRDLYIVDRQGRTESLKLTKANYTSPRMSPDGKRVATEVYDGKTYQIWIYDMAGTASIRQLTLEGNNRFPVWSADSERVTFLSDRGGDPVIWWQRANGTGPAEQLTHPEKGDVNVPLSWHPHEPTLMFVAGRANQPDPRLTLWTYSPADGKAQRFAGVESTLGLGAQFSPDGRWVAYSSRAPSSGVVSVYVRPYPSTDSTAYAVGAGGDPVWNKNAPELFFHRGPVLYVTRVTTSPTFAIGVPMALAFDTTSGGPGNGRDFDITPDGKLLTTRAERGAAADQGPAAPQIDVVLNWFEELKRLVPAK